MLRERSPNQASDTSKLESFLSCHAVGDTQCIVLEILLYESEQIIDRESTA